MANWISSKLKAAESILQQIDQQAADSLRKDERPPADELNFDSPTKTGGVVPLKDQLKKKTLDNNDYNGKFRSDPNFTTPNTRNKEISSSPKPSPKPKSTLTDSDWTELLSTPNQSPNSGVNRSNGGTANRGLRKKDGKRQGSSGSNLLVSEVKRNQKSSNGVLKSGQRLGEESKLNGKVGDGEDSCSSDSVGRSSSVDLQRDGRYLEGRESDRNEAGVKLVRKPKSEGNEEDGGNFESKEIPFENYSRLSRKIQPMEMISVLGKVDGVSNVKTRVDNVEGRLTSNIRGKHETFAALRSSVSDDLKRGSSSTTHGSSDSDSDSGSSSDSESEHEKEEKKRRMEKILAEKVAARAVEAIKERENRVARLEGEKQSLEKIFEERAKQQAKEASELQTTMMETLEAVDFEKQKHNNTRWEAFARLAKLETANADLARSLATVQWNLEAQVNRVAELRQQIDLKEATHEELRRRISDSHQTGTSLKQLAASKGIEFERETLGAEYSFIADKVAQLQDKAKKLEANIEMTRKEMEDPTEVEIELKRRLGQMTDHLIQKQAQVEALSSEKATLLFRIEAVSRLLDEDKSGTSLRDVESGTWVLSESKLGPLFHDRISSSRKHLGSLIQQLDSIFLAGEVFLRRNSSAKVWSLVYLVCLHFWVIYIFMSHSQQSNGTKSGAIISLENISNTTGV
ncbi:golgin candidate 2 [Corylus avellana]|uniref:golgin candidate 2 n=1 Tax=Corylus avellana TaxID=13451 RepID=UPI00286D671A|nr:golgin candidate 2 [Corylus avellana]